MISSGFGKRPKHKKFNYTPRFYDEQKEALEETLRNHSGDKNETDKVKARISSGLRSRYAGDESYKKQHARKSNIRIVYILLFLTMITYLILKSDRILKMVESFGI